MALKSAVTKKEDQIEVLQTFSLLFRLLAVLATPPLMEIMKMTKMMMMKMTLIFQSLLRAAAPKAAELCCVALLILGAKSPNPLREAANRDGWAAKSDWQEHLPPDFEAYGGGLEPLATTATSTAPSTGAALLANLAQNQNGGQMQMMMMMQQQQQQQQEQELRHRMQMMQMQMQMQMAQVQAQAQAQVQMQHHRPSISNDRLARRRRTDGEEGGQHEQDDQDDNQDGVDSHGATMPGSMPSSNFNSGMGVGVTGMFVAGIVAAQECLVVDVAVAQQYLVVDVAVAQQCLVADVVVGQQCLVVALRAA